MLFRFFRQASLCILPHQTAVVAGKPYEPVAHSGQSNSGAMGICALAVFKRSKVNHEPIFHVAFDHARIGVVDILDADDFDVRGNAVVTAKVEHLLGFFQASNE